MAFALVCILGLVALGIVAAVVSHFQGGDDEIIVGHDCASCSSKDSGECKIACLMERQRLLHESSEPLDLTEETQEVRADDDTSGMEKKRCEGNKTGG